MQKKTDPTRMHPHTLLLTQKILWLLTCWSNREPRSARSLASMRGRARKSDGRARKKSDDAKRSRAKRRIIEVRAEAADQCERDHPETAVLRGGDAPLAELTLTAKTTDAHGGMRMTLVATMTGGEIGRPGETKGGGSLKRSGCVRATRSHIYAPSSRLQMHIHHWTKL